MLSCSRVSKIKVESGMGTVYRDVDMEEELAKAAVSSMLMRVAGDMKAVME